MNTKRPPATDTHTRLLDIAERLAQTRGFNGFSYADIATELGIAKASLHHHFATKADLGSALMQRYNDNFRSAITRIDASRRDAHGKLVLYVRLYERVLENDRLCLCGMLAAEYPTLPKQIRTEVRRFFDWNEEWLANLVEAGWQDGSLRRTQPARDVARMILSALEGAMLLARSCEEPARFVSAMRPVLVQLAARPVRRKTPEGDGTRVTRAATSSARPPVRARTSTETPRRASGGTA